MAAALLFLAAGLPLWAGGSGERGSEGDAAPAGAETDGGAQPTTGNESGTITAGEFTFTWEVRGDDLFARMSAPTTGWVAVGFEPSSAMRDADMVIGYVGDSGLVLEDHFGNGLIRHASDASLGGASSVEPLEGTEEDGRTTIAFSRPLAATDDFDQPLPLGQEITVIYAFGPDGRDDLTTRHRARGSFQITIQ